MPQVLFDEIRNPKSISGPMKSMAPFDSWKIILSGLSFVDALVETLAHQTVALRSRMPDESVSVRNVSRSSL